VEFANQQTQVDLVSGIRVASRADAAAIMRLLHTAVYQHLHVDWHLPGDWLGSPGFVVLPQRSLSPLNDAAKFVGVREEMAACLAVVADVMPVAWVRVAALAELPQPGTVLAAMMAQAAAYLRQRHVTQIGWLVVEAWPRCWLEEMGFTLAHELETYVKEDTAVPNIPQPPDVHIRPVIRDEFEACTAVEAAAFAPLWRHSAHALKLAHSQALSFDVACVENEIAAFQLSVRSESGAHLVRMTVHPGWQGKGVGSALLTHTLAGYYRSGFQTVSLNTQVDNDSSQALYQKFGFRASGTRLPIWIKELNDDEI